jgi:hypothetical protein
MFGGDAGSRWWKIPLLPVTRTKTSREYHRLKHGPEKGVREKEGVHIPNV